MVTNAGKGGETPLCTHYNIIVLLTPILVSFVHVLASMNNVTVIMNVQVSQWYFDLYIDDGNVSSLVTMKIIIIIRKLRGLADDAVVRMLAM